MTGVVLEHGVRGAYVTVKLWNGDAEIVWRGLPHQARHIAEKLNEHADKAEAVRRNAETTTAAV